MMAAKELKRSVKVVLTRQQMYSFGHRPATIQTVALGASAEGDMTALYHSAIGETSQFEDYTEVVVNYGGMLYPPENVTLRPSGGVARREHPAGHAGTGGRNGYCGPRMCRWMNWPTKPVSTRSSSGCRTTLTATRVPTCLIRAKNSGNVSGRGPNGLAG